MDRIWGTEEARQSMISAANAEPPSPAQSQFLVQWTLLVAEKYVIKERNRCADVCVLTQREIDLGYSAETARYVATKIRNEKGLKSTHAYSIW